jgi:glycosyltransferase involved in cell wall biosynthesis
VTGYLFPVGAVEEMADAAVELLEDGDRHKRFSAAGRRTAVERFSASSVVPMYEAHYERVLRGGGA